MWQTRSRSEECAQRARTVYRQEVVHAAVNVLHAAAEGVVIIDQQQIQTNPSPHVSSPRRVHVGRRSGWKQVF